MPAQVIFVYNADSGLGNLVLDIAHKLVSPQTYSCNLCMITHDTFSGKKEFKDFASSLEGAVKFYHRDEFEKEYKQQFEYPCVLFEKEGEFVKTLQRNEIDDIKDFEVLRDRINNELRSIN